VCCVAALLFDMVLSVFMDQALLDVSIGFRWCVYIVCLVVHVFECYCVADAVGCRDNDCVVEPVLLWCVYCADMVMFSPAELHCIVVAYFCAFGMVMCVLIWCGVAVLIF